MQPSFWTYPGTWIVIVFTLLLVGGGIALAVVLRRVLRKPPQEFHLPPSSPEKNRPHE